MTDASQPKPLFATLAHGKLKHRTDVVAARMHNNREMDCENVDRDGPKPEVVFGPKDTWAGIKARFAELAIKPGKKAVHAVELVMGASEGWWKKDEDAQRIQRMAYERMAWKYLRGRYPPEAIISLTWHLDESNPHLHVVIVPIRRRVDGRFRDGRERWMLSARGDLSHAANGPDGKPLIGPDGKKVIIPAGEWRGGVGGIQQMENEQTIFAETMSVLSLVRGAKKSRADDGKSTREYRAELIAKTAEIGVQAAGLQDTRMDVAIEDDRQRHGAAELKRQGEELDAERAGWAASIAAREAALVADRAKLDADRLAMDERGRKATKWKREADARDTAQDERAEKIRTADDRLDERAGALADLVEAVTRAVATVDPEQLPPAHRQRFYDAAADLGGSVKRAARTSAVIAGTAAARGTWQGFQPGA